MILSGTVVFLKILPVREDIKERQKQKIAVNVLLKEMKGLVEMESELKKEYSNIPEADLLKLKEVAPSERKLTDYIVKIATLSEEIGIGLPVISFGAEGAAQNVGAFGATSIAMKLDGSYDSLKSFLKEIEKFVRITDIGNLSFSAPEKIGSSLQITLTGRIYHLLSQ